MKFSPFEKLIAFDEFSATPKYQQLANSIIKAIENGKLQEEDVLPSINELSFQFDISRDTAEKGYKYLKSIGLIGSVPGKGYFIKNAQLHHTRRVFLLFNKLSPHKKIIYDSFAAALGPSATIDFYIYNNDLGLFKKMLHHARDDYHNYVIIPHFLEAGESAQDVINHLPKEKLILLDKLVPGISGNFGAVFENFEKDISGALQQALPHLNKYHTIKLIFPENSYYPHEIVSGFTSFCQQHSFAYKVAHNIESEPINEGEVFINLMDDDLVVLIERIIALGFELGRQVGVISYNETPLKRIILNGITTISTDFAAMGAEAARLIRDQQQEHVEIPFYLTLRASL